MSDMLSSFSFILEEYDLGEDYITRLEAWDINDTV